MCCDGIELVVVVVVQGRFMVINNNLCGTWWWVCRGYRTQTVGRPFGRLCSAKVDGGH